MAGFEVTLYGRIWVTPEEIGAYLDACHPALYRNASAS